MVVRYVPLAKAPASWRSEDYEVWVERPSVTVWQEEKAPVYTGLLDSAGTRLFRVEEPEPLGFDTRRVR